MKKRGGAGSQARAEISMYKVSGYRGVPGY